MTPQTDELRGKKVNLSGHFNEPVIIEDFRKLGSGYELRVRRPSGQLEETVLSETEFNALLGVETSETTISPVNPIQLRLLIESLRIRLACTYDLQFAVSLSGIRTFPHQIEAVYMKMLPQPRLRFLLADDPGAGKTIMAGLLLKEMKLREAIERILIVVPAPLTIQWQDELLRFFGETFQIIHTGNDQQQLINLWQRESQVITSMDYAKQEDIRERVWQPHWDMVIVDEAHKCSAYTKRSGGKVEAEKTKRYQLAEKLTSLADHVLFLTATPHHGDDDRFGHFLRLLDEDLFPEPHRFGEQARVIRRGILSLGPDCPWALRRLKEDLKDMTGHRLFPDRHPQTITFRLNKDEFALYKAVTSYINEFLPKREGRQKMSVALTRTVFQRRLASSTRAIFESLRRRLEKQQKILEDLETMSPAERVRYLEKLRGRLTDEEQDEDDLDEGSRNDLVDEFTVAQELDQIRQEVAVLKGLVEQAREVKDHAADSKLASLKECLTYAQFSELKDGRGKLLVFTESRDTMEHITEHLGKWGYTTCNIHGGMNPHERKRAQEDFRTRAQICIATEAAGEGINLQFCHLMINYDMPWNPTRLEQRMGRIHRIGQERDVYVFNFVADQSEDGEPIIEGAILKRLLEKLDIMRAVLSGRVFDVIGEVLSLNDVNLSEMLREAAYDPRRLDEYIDQIDRIDPEKLHQYEEATGIALAKSVCDFSAFQQSNFETEERRLMPEYVARQFIGAADIAGLKVELRADGLWRVEYVPQDFRSERLEAVKRLGKPEDSYRKITFYKKHLEMDQHLDAVLMGPGHPLYAAVDEKLNEKLGSLQGQVAAMVDSSTQTTYWLHFLQLEVRGEPTRNNPHSVIHSELIAVHEEDGKFSPVPSDIHHDLAPYLDSIETLPKINIQAAIDFVKGDYQLEVKRRIQEERKKFADITRKYLEMSFDTRIRNSQKKVMDLKAKEASGETEYAFARQRAERDLVDLERTHRERLANIDRISIARPGPIQHIASLLVLPPGERIAAIEDEEAKREVELAAMDVVMNYERNQGWEPFDVSEPKLKLGFDIRSLGPADTSTGHRAVRRIEVKGRKRGSPIRLTTNEWLKARQLGETYWLYVVWDPKEAEARPERVQDPGNRLDHLKKEIREISHYELSADAIEKYTEKEVK
jgi:SNF2 family DNA or RNA helicase